MLPDFVSKAILADPSDTNWLVAADYYRVHHQKECSEVIEWMIENKKRPVWRQAYSLPGGPGDPGRYMPAYFRWESDKYSISMPKSETLPFVIYKRLTSAKHLYSYTFRQYPPWVTYKCPNRLVKELAQVWLRRSWFWNPFKLKIKYVPLDYGDMWH